MLIIPYVCAEFRDKTGNVLYRITPAMRGVMQEAPDNIWQDTLFDMLVKDGSIRTPETAKQKKVLENDPMVGVTAEGKSEQTKTAGNEKSAKGPKGTKTETQSVETDKK